MKEIVLRCTYLLCIRHVFMAICNRETQEEIFRIYLKLFQGELSMLGWRQVDNLVPLKAD